MLKLTPEAIKFILLQRTQLKKRSTIEEIETDFRKDFETYEKFLPESCEVAVDIGCGIGVQDIFLMNKLPKVDVLLIDKTYTEKKIWYGYKKEGAFYNSFEETTNMMIDNGYEKRISFQEALNGIIQLPNNSVDLITSFISWGFHYPVETYLDEALRVMKPGATLIIDVRKQTNGYSKLSEKFGYIRQIKDFKKYTRVICKKVI